MPETPTRDHAASLIRCDDVSVVFDKAAAVIDSVCTSFAAGKIASIVGPSGCGKTTLLRTLAGLQRPSSGRVTLTPPAESRSGEIAFVFQQPALLPWRTALQNVLLPLELSGAAGDKREIARDALASVQLADAADQFPDQLSGGMQMRVSLARALVTRPRVLLLDEPFAALDEMLRNELGQLLLELWRQHRFTAVMVTHNIAESILLSHRVIVMREGRVAHSLENQIPFPRNPDLIRTASFGEFYGRVSDLIQGRSMTESVSESPI